LARWWVGLARLSLEVAPLAESFHAEREDHSGVFRV
jgi:hypothetical protein